MNRTELKDRIAYYEREAAFLKSINPDCNRCVLFQPTIGFCKKHDAKVPTEYIAQGCNAWEFDDVPF